MRQPYRSGRLFAEPFAQLPTRPAARSGNARFAGIVALLSIATFASVWALPGTPAAAVNSNTAGSRVYYSGCNEARAAGAAPIYRGQPGYRPEMDGDDDGIACEPHRNR